MSDRTLLNRARTPLGADTAYLTPDSVDLDVSQAYEVVRRRVFFDDVSMVTLHHERGIAFLVVTGVFGAACLAAAVFIVAVNVDMWPVALPFVVAGLPAFVAFLLRLAKGRSVVTVFGRRSRAVLRFGVFRSAKAREVYGRVCAAVRRAQSGAAGFSPPDSPESPAPPLPADIPLPPPAQ